MTPSETQAIHLEMLSDRVLRNLSPDAWSEIFMGEARENIRFEPTRGTVVYAMMQVDGWGASASPDAELSVLADSLGGELDPCPGGAALVRFNDPLAALAMALEMNQLASGVRFQVGIASGPCVLAHLRVGEVPLQILLGDAVRLAEAHCHLAPAGTIRISGETAPLYQRVIGQLARCVVTTEFDGSGTAAVNLALAPPAGADLSSFAGLGLT